MRLEVDGSLPDDEMVDLVDAQDRVVGSATIRRCLEGSLLHRAVAVLVTRSDGRFVLQRRSLRDMWQPGLLTISSTGHVKQGEGYEAAAKRELKEELGLEGRLAPVRKYTMPALSYNGLTEHEWVSLFTCQTDSPCTIDPAELDGVREVTEGELRNLLEGGQVAPDAKVILTDFLKRKS